MYRKSVLKQMQYRFAVKFGTLSIYIHSMSQGLVYGKLVMDCSLLHGKNSDKEGTSKYKEEKKIWILLAKLK